MGSGFGAQQQVIADILLDEAIAILAADHRVGKMDIFDHGLQFAAILPGDFLPKLTVILFGWPMVRLTSSKCSPI